MRSVYSDDRYNFLFFSYGYIDVVISENYKSMFIVSKMYFFFLSYKKRDVVISLSLAKGLYSAMA